MIKTGYSGMHEAKNIQWAIGKIPEIKASQVKSELTKVLSEYYKKHSSPYIGSQKYSISCGTVDLSTGMKGATGTIITGHIFVHGEIIANGEVINKDGLVVTVRFTGKVYDADGSVNASEVNRVVSTLVKARESALKNNAPSDVSVS